MCGRLSCDKLGQSICHTKVTKSNCEAYEAGEKAYFHLKTVEIWLPEGILPLTICLAFFALASSHVILNTFASKVFTTPSGNKSSFSMTFLILLVSISFLPALLIHSRDQTERTRSFCEGIMKIRLQRSLLRDELLRVKEVFDSRFDDTVLRLNQQKEQTREILDWVGRLAAGHEMLKDKIEQGHAKIEALLKNTTYDIKVNPSQLPHPAISRKVDDVMYFDGTLRDIYIPLGFALNKFFDISSSISARTNLASRSNEFAKCVENFEQRSLFFRKWTNEYEAFLIPLSWSPVATLVAVVCLSLIFAPVRKNAGSSLIPFLACVAFPVIIIGFPLVMESHLHGDQCNQVTDQSMNMRELENITFASAFEFCHNSVETTEKPQAETEFWKVESARIQEMIEDHQRKKDVKVKLMYLNHVFTAWISFLMLKIIYL